MGRKKSTTRGSKRSRSEGNEANRQLTSSADEADDSRNDSSYLTNDDASPTKRKRNIGKTADENKPEKRSSVESSKSLKQDDAAAAAAAAGGDQGPFLEGPLLDSTLIFLQAILKPPKHDVGTQTDVSLAKRKIKEIEKRLSEQEIAELQIALEMHRDVNGPEPN